MSAPSSYTVEHDIKGKARKFRCGSRQLRDFRDSRRKAAVRPARSGGKDAAKKAAARMGHCVGSIKEWIKLWEAGGDEALNEKIRAPKTVKKPEQEKIDQVLAVRDRRGYGCSKIAREVGCSSGTVHKYLKMNDRTMVPKPRTRFRRFERAHANTLWQMDRTMLDNGLWVLQVVDDRSRFIVGTAIMRTPDVDETIQLPERCFSLYGVPEQFLTDHGTQFYNVRGGTSAFDRFCLTVTVEHIPGSIAHPQTPGKTERRHCMLKDRPDKKPAFVDKATEEEIEEAIEDLVRGHNYDGPHEGWMTYRMGSVVKHKKVCFLPFMRFVCHGG